MSRAIKVLVVEDSEDDAKLVMRTLRRSGFEPLYRRVEDIEALRSAFRDEHWDAVLSDFRMPGFTGVEALTIFRSFGLDIPFIFVSGTIGEETAVAAMKAGASDYVMKEHLARLAPVLERELAQAAIRAEHRQAQQAVAQHERLRALGQMASGIAHDINNALSPAALYVQSLLEREIGLSARARERLQQVDRAIAHVAATVGRLREFYRQSDPPPALARLQANPLVHQVLELTHARWSDMPQQRGTVVELRTELAPNLPPVLGVDSELRDALVNLVFNAVDAMPGGGTLTVRTRVLDGPWPQVVVEVSDTGIGMSEETRRRCLEPFFTTKGELGTGLGLAMVYGAVQRHGGQLQIDSAVGRGTTVSLHLPMAQAGAAAAPFEQPAATVLPSLRLLVVDDDPLLLKSLQDSLQGDGHVVTTAQGGQAGIDFFLDAQARGEPFAAVITDLGMPHIDGHRVAAAVKAASPATPVILLTGWGRRLIGNGERPEHVDEVVGKPPRLRELREALARQIRTPHE
jgi:signal transduction histidine kinase